MYKKRGKALLSDYEQKKSKINELTVGFAALGCPKNVVDSEKMLGLVAESGFLISSDVDNCDVVIINTCGFIEPAKQEALDVIGRAIERKREGFIRKIVVAGCLSERMGAGLLEEAKGIDAVVGLGQRDNISRIISGLFSDESERVYLGHDCNFVSDDQGRLLITGEHSAYLRISEGCDHKCSFCTIPAIRGPFRSKPLEMVVSEATELASCGVKELSVIAQDTAYYGKDTGMKNGLAKVIGELEKVEGLQWLRLMYLYPVGITDVLLDSIAKSKKVLRYFDMPIQHISDEILKSMRRPDSKKMICELIEKIRDVFPETVLRTTVIVGYPGETEKHFQELLDFVEDAGFDALGCFPYYAEEGTEAAKMDGQVPERVKHERVERLMLAQQRIAFEKNRQRIGDELECLVDSVEGGEGIGRFFGQALEIDSVCIIKNIQASPGSFIKARVIGSKDYDLIVEQI